MRPSPDEPVSRAEFEELLARVVAIEKQHKEEADAREREILAEDHARVHYES